ncbi:MAG: prepilin peptidase [candidate division WOR-3 bacterium]|nr:MAG: prepilin peptidase [candidate division WOR-3 bacterium]
MNFLYSLWFFFLGAAIGSFLNVVIYRMPRELSIIKPRSFCPNCKKPIQWFENIPIASFIFLGGRCSQCKTSISIHYPAVEVITGFLVVYLFLKHGLNVDFLFYLLFFCSLIVISGIDYIFQIVPDIISIPGIVLGILFQIIKGNFVSGIVGMLFGGGLILLIRIIGGRVYKKEVMGLGDVFLTAMIGAFVGFPLVIPAIFIGALVGASLGIVYLISTRQSRESPIPFGPFLSIGGIVVVVLEQQIVQFFVLFQIYL